MSQSGSETSFHGSVPKDLETGVEGGALNEVGGTPAWALTADEDDSPEIVLWKQHVGSVCEFACLYSEILFLRQRMMPSLFF